MTSSLKRIFFSTFSLWLLIAVVGGGFLYNLKSYVKFGIILLAESKKLCIQEGTIGGAVPGGNFMLPPIFVTEKLSDKVCISALKIAKDYLPMRYHYTHATNRKQCAKTRKAA